MAGVGEGFKHVPQGAGAAVVGEVEAGGGLAFGHVAGAVDAHEGKGDAAQVWPLQGGQPVGGCLIAHAKELAEVFDVVAGFLGLGVEDFVGQHYGGREVGGDAADG